MAGFSKVRILRIGSSLLREVSISGSPVRVSFLGRFPYLFCSVVFRRGVFFFVAFFFWRSGQESVRFWGAFSLPPRIVEVLFEVQAGHLLSVKVPFFVNR